MSDDVRVKDPVSGHEYNVPRSRLTVCPDLQVINKPTGRTKPRLPLGTPIPGGKVARKRAAKKSPAAPRKRAAKKSSAAKKSPAGQNDGQPVATDKEQ